MKQLYFIAIEKLAKAGFHERYSNDIPESKLWMEAVEEWLTQKSQETLHKCVLSGENFQSMNIFDELLKEVKSSVQKDKEQK